MKKTLFCIIVALGMALAASAQTLEYYKVPHVNPSADRRASIAANYRGDIVVAYVNNRLGAMYYWKEHGTNTWLGPTVIPNQPWGEGWGEDFWNTDVAAAPDGKFHFIYSMIEAPPYSGIHYQVFDPVSKTWFGYEHIVSGMAKAEEPVIGVNPKNGDVLVSWCWVLGLEKDIYVKTRRGSSWGDTVCLSQGYGPGSTNAQLAFDETGRAYSTYKMDRLLSGRDWELVVRLHLLDEDNNNESLWRDEPTWDYDGWHFLPSVAVLKDGTGICTFAWPQRGAYYYFDFKVANNAITYDASTIPDNNIVGLPRTPWYEFHSKVLSMVDEFGYVFTAGDHTLKMFRYKDGIWDHTNIPISNGEAVGWPIDASYEPRVGVLSAWYTRGDPSDVGFSIYPLIRSVLLQPINLTLEHKTERSMFRAKYLNILTWANDPNNTAQDIVISKYNVYRRAKGTAPYTWIGSVDASATLTYIDRNGVTATNNFDYAVSAVDTEGKESPFTEIQ